MAEISADDARTLFQDCVISYKGIPHKVFNINNDLRVRMKNLLNQKVVDVDLVLKDFCTPLPRLGFMNHSSNGVVYVERKPVRRYQAGINANNINVHHLEINYPEPRERVQRAALLMECSEFSDMLTGHYPPIREAIDSVKEHGGAVAFDRQFCIDDGFNIYWKTEKVGSLPKNCRTIERIQFNNGYESLHSLIGKNYEKVA